MATDYIATLRLTFKAEDDISAQLIAELSRERAEMELDTEEDQDEAILTQVTSLSTDIEPTEVLDRLCLARNDLIRTRYKECWNTAKGLDQLIHALRRRLQPEEVTDYDHGRFLEISHEVLLNGGNPVP